MLVKGARTPVTLGACFTSRRKAADESYARDISKFEQQGQQS